MNLRSGRRKAGGEFARFVIESLALFGAVALPLALLDGWIGIFAAAAIIALYVRRRGGRGMPRESARPEPHAGFQFLRGVAMFLAFLSVTILPILVWILWAFPQAGGTVGLSLSGALWLATGVLLGTLGMAGLALSRLRQDGEVFGRFAGRMRAGGAWEAFRPAARDLALSFGLMGAVSVGASMPGIKMLIERMTEHGHHPDWLEVAITMPAVPIWLFASVVLLVLCCRPPLGGDADGPPHDAEAASRRLRPALTGFSMVACAAVILGSIGHVMHLGVFGVYGPIAEIGPMTNVSAGIGDWVADQRALGRSNREIAAELQRQGHWAPESPDAGLIELMPMLKDVKSSDTIGGSACRYSVDAGVADLENLRGVDWLLAEQASQPVKYCLAVACPSPTRWEDDSTLSLFSSHTSRNRYWIEDMFVDLFAWGADAPGGYCTTTGAVSERYQG